jgi:hypothetical protein
MGGSIIDIISKPASTIIVNTSNPGVVMESPGGVARNIVDVLGQFGCCNSGSGGDDHDDHDHDYNVKFYTALGYDSRGACVYDSVMKYGNVDVVNTYGNNGNNDNDVNTSVYNAILDHNNDLNVAIVDVDGLKYIKSPEQDVFDGTDLFVFDSNAEVDEISKALDRAERSVKTKVFWEPTSIPKTKCVIEHGLISKIDYAKPNYDEFIQIATSLGYDVDDDEDVLFEKVQKRMRNGAVLFISMGSTGVIVVNDNGVKRYIADPLTVSLSKSLASLFFVKHAVLYENGFCNDERRLLYFIDD